MAVTFRLPVSIFDVLLSRLVLGSLLRRCFIITVNLVAAFANMEGSEKKIIGWPQALTVRRTDFIQDPDVSKFARRVGYYDNLIANRILDKGK
jgi:hypothetical protein